MTAKGGRPKKKDAILWSSRGMRAAPEGQLKGTCSEGGVATGSTVDGDWLEELKSDGRPLWILTYIP